MVEMYRADCPSGWATGPNDGYYFEQLLHHLAGSGDTPGTARLLFDPDWMQAKLSATGLYSVIVDYDGVLGGDPAAAREVREALLHAAPALLAAPRHLAALLADRLQEPARPATAELVQGLRDAAVHPRLRLRSRSLMGGADELLATVRTAGQRLHAVSVLPGDERFASGGEDGMLRIHALDTGRVIDEVATSGGRCAPCPTVVTWP